MNRFSRTFLEGCGAVQERIGKILVAICHHEIRHKLTFYTTVHLCNLSTKFNETLAMMQGITHDFAQDWCCDLDSDTTIAAALW